MKYKEFVTMYLITTATGARGCYKPSATESK